MLLYHNKGFDLENIQMFLGQDHRDCDDVFANTENAIVSGDWNMTSCNFKDMSTLFLRHFEMEESVLFPDFECASGMSCGPTHIMRMEHEQMRRAMQSLENAINNKDQEMALGVCETFNILVQQHNSKEEMVLYSMADQVLESRMEDVIKRMKEIA